MPATESQLDTSSTRQLTIRVKIIPGESSQVPEEPPQSPTRPRFRKSALLLIVGAVAVGLSWVGFKAFRSDPTPPAAAPASVSEAPPAKPPVATTTTPPSEPEVRLERDAPPSAINEVLPDVPQSALNTIRGTVRVSVRVTIDKRGTVTAAAAHDRGPSRYFERLSVAAGKDWTFTPANLADERTMLVKFNYTRDGATAQASALP